MTIQNEILIAANQIANKGNKPTVALIKTKLNKKVPLPVIISTLKTWQHEPNFISLLENKVDINEPANKTKVSTLFEQSLYDELTYMKKEIVDLKNLVKQLIDQQSN